MKQLSIGLVIDDSLDRPDGVQQYVTTLGKWLESQGHKVHYITGGPQDKQRKQVHVIGKNVQVRFNGNRLSLPLPVNRAKIEKLLTSDKFDVLHVQLPCSPWLAGRVVEAASEQTALVGTFHIVPESPFIKLVSKGLELYERSMLERFHVVASVSPAAQDFALDAFGLKSSVVPNAINLKAYKLPAKPRQTKEPLTIIFLGRLVERKGCKYLLKAIARLVKQPNLPEFRVLIAGRGPLEMSLKDYVVRHKLEDHVSFSGFIAEADKPKFLGKADIAVFPSTGGESFGIVLLEAMAGVPGAVLAGNNEGYASVMYPHDKQLFEPQDSRGLADKLAYYLQTESARQRARAWQAEHVKQFSIDLVGPRILKLYDQALLRSR
ncbi:MAG TPA: glycosyltransferase family 4 protein [Candidatus Binatia bacterium]|nr:glycosyltransferase family 4 protein [Candidatus Binatia bacterium]